MRALTLRSSVLVLSALTAGLAFGQDTLTLEEALRMARENNGSVRSAYLNYEASRASVSVANSAFLPTVTPQFSRQWGETNQYTGFGRGNFDTTGSSAFVNVNWQLWDNGTRRLNLRQASLNADSQELTALQTLRSTLFDVERKFYDALRTQKLLEVQDRNVERAKAILDETEARTKPPIEDLPRKDVFQARADFQNALVSQLAAQNRVSTSTANLKAVVALDARELPSLEEPAQNPQFPDQLTLEQAIAEGLTNRPDLVAQRKREESQVLQVKSTKLRGNVQYSLDANYRRGFLEDSFQQTQLVLSASLPLYDGARTRENTRIEELNLQAIRANIGQAELDVEAEIESAYLQLSQNLKRLEAAKVALEAAKVNYDLTQEAYSKYRAATLVERLTAQVTLTTAESNLVEATYDTLISEAQLSLALGRSMAGEIPPEEMKKQ